MAPSPSTVSLLSDTLSPHPPTVLHAENLLHAREFRPSFLTQLFQIAIATPASSNDAAVALAGAIYFKNLIRRAWQNVHTTTNDTKASLLPDEDRDYVRAHIVPALISADNRIQAQLLEALKRIISADFPIRFPFLIDQIMTRLSSDQPSVVYAALVALRALAKVYEIKIGTLVSRHDDDFIADQSLNRSTPSEPDLSYLHQNPRAALNYLVHLIFPSLLRIMFAIESTIDKTHPSQRDYQFDMQRVVCKIFWSFTQYDLPTYLTCHLDGPLTEWMNVFLSALRRPVYHLHNVHDVPLEEDLRCMSQWKVKQWISNIVYRLFQRYNNPSRLPENQVRNIDINALTKFGDYFRRTFAASFTLAMLEMLAADQRLISPRVANLALLYIETAVSSGLTYKVIKPSLQPLIANVIFPYLCITDSDLLLWEDDPIEYVRKTYNVQEDFNTPRAAACSLLYVMVKLRHSSVIAPLISFLNGVLEEYASVVKNFKQDLAAPETNRNKLALARRKDGVLLAIGTIQDSLAVHPQGKEYLSALLETHVLHEFDSDLPFLRARACWLYGQFAVADGLTDDVLHRALVCVQRRLTDPEFPVRVRAAVDIRHFIQNSASTDAIAPHLSDLLHMLFSMLDDVDSTDIVATIDQLAVVFSDRIVPLAPELCARLVQTFSRSATSGHGDEEAAFAAAQCLQAVASIVTSVAVADHNDKLKMFEKMEQSIAPVFDHMFEEERLDYFEEAVELLVTLVHHGAEERGAMVKSLIADRLLSYASLTRSCHEDAELYKDGKVLEAMRTDVVHGGGAISAYLWSLFPRAVYAFHDWASDYSVHYLQLVDAYTSRGMRVFLTLKDGDTSYPQLMIGMVSRLWEECSVEEQDLVMQGSQICDLFLRHCRRVERQDMNAEACALTKIVIGRLQKGQTGETVIVALIRCLAHLLYLAPVVVLMEIDMGLGCTLDVFKLWLGLVHQGQLYTRYDCKASAIALCAILGSDWMQLPTAVRQSIPQLFMAIVSLLERLAGMGRRRMESGDDSTDVSLAADDYGNNAAREGKAATIGVITEGYDTGGDGADEDICILAEETTESNWGDDDEDTDTLGPDSGGGKFTVVDDVDELLLFESVVRRLPPNAWQHLGMALAKADTMRVQSTLNRAAHTRTLGMHVNSSGEIVCD